MASLSPYAQVVRVHKDGRRVIVEPRLGWRDAREMVERLNSGEQLNDEWFEVEREV